MLKSNIPTLLDEGNNLHLKLTEKGDLYFNNRSNTNIKITDLAFYNFDDTLLNIGEYEMDKLYIARDSGTVYYAVETMDGTVLSPIFKSNSDTINELVVAISDLDFKVESLDATVVRLTENISDILPSANDYTDDKISALLGIVQF